MAQDPRAAGGGKRPGTDFVIRAVGRRESLHLDLFHRVLVTSWPRFFLGVGAAFAMVNVVFALLYLAQPGGVTGARPGSFEDAFFLSVQTLGTIGYGSLSPGTTYTQLVMTAESLVGLVAVAIVTGLTYAKFARPTSRVTFSAKAVVGRRDGVNHLMFRLANARHNNIVEAQLRVVLLEDQLTLEGERLRVQRSLPLLRDTNAFFRLSWTASHIVDESSPFHGPDAGERLRAKNTLVLLTVTGIDETIAQVVHARYFYGLDDIVWGGRFHDVISTDADGTRVIDYEHFHDVVSEDA